MDDRGGHPAGREPTELELEHLRLLLELRTRAQRFASEYDERLSDFVLELREAGCSARGLADAAGVGSSTIQGWTTNARRRRNQSTTP